MKKISIECLIMGGILVLAVSCVSVVGTKSGTEIQSGTIVSPLFQHRIEQSTNHQQQKLFTTYLGKGRTASFGFSSKSTSDGIIDDVANLICRNPQFIDRIVAQMKNLPATQQMLKKYGLTQMDLERYIAQIKNDPLLMQREMEQAKKQIREGKTPGQPLGLNTSNPFGCVITIIALLPVIAALLVLVLLIATITIITCLNVNNCLTNLTDQLTNIITQELLPP